MNWTRLLSFRAVYRPEGGGGGGGEPPKEPVITKPEEKKPEEKKIPEKTFSEKQVADSVAAALQKAKDDAEIESKKKQGDFEKLYDTVQPKLVEAEATIITLKKENETLTELLKTNIKSMMEGWPKAVTDLYDSTLTIPQQLEWVKKAAVLAKGTVNTKPVQGEHGKQQGEGKIDPAKRYLGSRYSGPPSVTKK